jgi:hypothetical protein
MSDTATPIEGRKRAKVKQLPPKAFLEECFEYSRETGDLKWKVRPIHHFPNTRCHKLWNTKFSGITIKSCAGNGHLGCSIFYKRVQSKYLAHRIIFALLGIDLPNGLIVDHINGNAKDNRFSNLRIATNQQNSFNSVTKKRTRNHGLPRGVYPSNPPGKFVAKIRHSYKEICLGTFLSPQEAHAAYVAKANTLRGEFVLIERDPPP